LKYYRIAYGNGSFGLSVELTDGILSSLDSLNDEVDDFKKLCNASYITGLSIDEISKNILSKGSPATFDLKELIQNSQKSRSPYLAAAVQPDEMWAGGMGNLPVPDDVVPTLPEPSRVAFEGDRGIVVYKGNSSRLADPFGEIGIRSDIPKTISEGELVVIMYKGKIVGYSTGNEVAGGLAGETLWYLNPSKVFKGCASLAPCIVTPDSLPDPTKLKMNLTITRNGEIVDSTSNITEHRRSPEKLVSAVMDHDVPAELSILYTGGCVASAPMEIGDVVRIDLEGIGFVENTVIQV
tara:strand:- start:373 stop:1257 length:885 start_codon:yes stop_codon:yes gene_type:complete